MCRAGGTDAELLLERIGQTWDVAARWPGPPDHSGYREAMAQGMIATDPDAIRAAVRDWLDELLAGEGCRVALREDWDWADWDEELRR